MILRGWPGVREIRRRLKTDNVLAEVGRERLRQHAKFGEQNLRDGTDAAYGPERDAARELCDLNAAFGTATWKHVLAEETLEAFAEENPANLRKELVQVAAVVVAWIEAIDRRDA